MTSDSLKASASIITAFPAAPTQNGLFHHKSTLAPFCYFIAFHKLNSITFKVTYQIREGYNLNNGWRTEIRNYPLMVS